MRSASGGARPLVAAMLGAFLFFGVAVSVVAQERADETEILESAPRTHTVQRGDTLWDLAGSYLSNPYRWPSIYEINTSVIEDPHWIYPGEILALPDGIVGAMAVADQLRNDAQAVSERDVWEVVDRSDAPVGTRRPVSWFGGGSIFDTSPESGNVLGGLDVETYAEPVLVREHDFRRSPMLVEKNDYRSHGRAKRVIEGNPLHMNMLPAARLRDVVIVELRGLAVEPGDELRAIRWHAGARGLEIAESLAILKVLDADQESARTVVTRLYGDFKIGDHVIALEDFDVPATLQQAVDTEGLEAELVAAEVRQPLMSEGDMVFLDLGAEDGVRIGDEFVVFDHRDGPRALVEDRLATVRVVRTEAETATARIIDLRDTSPEVGAPARRVRRAIGS